MTPITDRSGRVVAYENDVSEYRKEIRDRSNGLLAHFNPKDGPQGRTFDRTGRLVGNGDQRTRFIRDE
jgi:hypothetical protein